jgi:peptidase E
MSEELQNNPLSDKGKETDNLPESKPSAEKPDTTQSGSTPESSEEKQNSEATSPKPTPETKSNEEQPDVNPEAETDKGADDEQSSPEESMPDYTSMSKEELLQALKEIVIDEDISGNKARVDAIKNNFYKLKQAEIADLKRLHTESGKDPMDFEPPHDKDETYLKELLDDFKKKKAEHNKQIEAGRQENLKKKEEIIEKIKVLANGEESLNKTFEEFRDLQKQWQSIGNVPKESVKDLWQSYNHQIERFYDFIKINKELRDLDFRKNMEAKIKLCEKAETLLLEPDIKSAWDTLQKLHDQWRETGPVPKENRDELWERFSKATREINKKHQDYFLEKKEERKKNLEAKTALCEKAEAIAGKDYDNIKDWNQYTNEILEVQKVWKTIGMVPKKYNSTIYERFRSACNVFFDKKHDFFKERHSHMEENLQKKTDLCVQAEALKDSTEWNKTRDALIDLQKEWKNIGPVPRKESDAIWKRFRAACDHFFNARNAYFKDKKVAEKENAEKKRKLIEEVKAFKPSDNKEENLKAIQDFQARYSSIGFVPVKEKDRLHKAFRKAIDDIFGKLDMSVKNLNQMQFQSQVDMWVKENDVRKLQNERQQIKQKINKNKEDIVLLENNMSFFSGSSSETVLKDVRDKINKAKKSNDNLHEKRKMLDLAIRNLKDNE